MKSEIVHHLALTKKVYQDAILGPGGDKHSTVRDQTIHRAG